MTKRDHASNSVLGLGCGVRVAQVVNNPEIGSKSKPIRIQLVMLSVVDAIVRFYYQGHLAYELDIEFAFMVLTIGEG